MTSLSSLPCTARGPVESKGSASPLCFLHRLLTLPRPRFFPLLEVEAAGKAT